MARAGKGRVYKKWTPEEIRTLRQHARARTPVSQIAKEMKRSGPTIRMKGYELGFSVGAGRRAKKGADLAKSREKREYRWWTPKQIKALRRHSRVRTPVWKIAKQMKRSEPTLRMKAYQLGFSLGHRNKHV